MKRLTVAILIGLVLVLLSSQAVWAAPSAKKVRTCTYVVKRGDTVWGIARKYGISVKTIVRWNKLPNRRLIYPRQKLTIPYCKKPAPRRTCKNAYRVKRGDTLLSIACRKGTTVEALMRKNNIKSGQKIYTGQCLKIPKQTLAKGWCLDQPPEVTVDIESQTTQYSDLICGVTLEATDAADDPLTVSTGYCVAGTCSSGLPASLALTSQGCVDSGDGIWHTCSWTLDGPFDVPQGAYVITFTVDDGDGGQVLADTTLIVEPEDADLRWDDNNPASVQVDGVTWKAYVQEIYPDDAVCGPDPGEISDAQVQVFLEPLGPGQEFTAVCANAGVSGSSYDAVLTAECSFDELPDGLYRVGAIVVGGYYSSGFVEGHLYVYR